MPNDNFNEAFSRRLRFYLNKYDMTQIELAKRLGVGKSPSRYAFSGIRYLSGFLIFWLKYWVSRRSDLNGIRQI